MDSKTIARVCKRCGNELPGPRRSICDPCLASLNATHGQSGTRLYRVYRSMLERCGSPKNKGFANYGARGITVCERWAGKNGFENFLADMGERPSGMSIERKDNNGPYSPENCVWATPQQQSENKRNNVLLTYQGRTQILAVWAKELGISKSRLGIRLKKYPLDKAMQKGRLKPMPWLDAK